LSHRAILFARGQAVIQVEARPPLIQTASPAMGDEISNQRVTSLPLVVENSYAADQGLVSGAQVNIVSRSGSNRFAGTAYEFFRNSALDAKNYFDDPFLPIPPFSAPRSPFSQRIYPHKTHQCIHP